METKKKSIYLEAMKATIFTLFLVIVALATVILWINPVVSEVDFINIKLDQKILSVIDENSEAGIGYIDNQLNTKNDFSQCMNESRSFVFRRNGDYKTCLKKLTERYTDDGSKKIIDEIKKAFEQ